MGSGIMGGSWRSVGGDTLAFPRARLRGIAGEGGLGLFLEQHARTRLKMAACFSLALAAAVALALALAAALALAVALAPAVALALALAHALAVALAPAVDLGSPLAGATHVHYQIAQLGSCSFAGGLLLFLRAPHASSQTV